MLQLTKTKQKSNRRQTVDEPTQWTTDCTKWRVQYYFCKRLINCKLTGVWFKQHWCEILIIYFNTNISISNEDLVMRFFSVFRIPMLTLHNTLLTQQTELHSLDHTQFQADIYEVVSLYPVSLVLYPWFSPSFSKSRGNFQYRQQEPLFLLCLFVLYVQDCGGGEGNKWLMYYTHFNDLLLT